MKNILLDTNAVVSLFKGDMDVLNSIVDAERTYMSIFVLGELYSGFKGGNREKENTKILKEFLSRSYVQILDATIETSFLFGFVKSQLKGKGKPLPINDIWIASHTMEFGAQLITYDKHFEEIDGLRIWP